MATNDLALIDASKPDGATERVNVLDNYQRELRAAIKAWAAIEHDLKGRHKFSSGTTASRPVTTGDTPAVAGTAYFNTDTGEIEYYTGSAWKGLVPQQRNLLQNSSFERWESSTKPLFWTGAGAGAVFSKNTTGGQFKIGAASLQIQRVGNNCTMSQNFLTLAPEYNGPTGYWDSRPLAAGVWARASVANTVRMYLLNVNGSTTIAQSAAHTGGGNFEWLSCNGVSGDSSSGLSIVLQVDTSDTTAQFDGAMVVLGSTCPIYVPDMDRYNVATKHFLTLTSVIGGSTVYMTSAGQIATETEVLIPVSYPILVRRMFAKSSGAPGAAQTYTYTLRKNAADTAKVVTLSGAGATAGSDVTNDIYYAAGDTISMKLVTSAGAATFFHAVEIGYEIIPA